MGHTPSFGILLWHRVLSRPSRTLVLTAVVASFGLPLSLRATTSVDPLPLWTISDDELSVPIGTVVDVAVGGDGVVYLLDTQNWTVLRIGVDGSELRSLGRRGEGPGEFSHPLSVAARNGGGCVVVQDFYSPAVCLDATGAICKVPDLSLIRNQFVVTQFFGARTDNHGRLLITAMTTNHTPGAASPNSRPEIGWSIFRVGVGDQAAAVLFSDRVELCEETTVALERYGSSYTDRCWDVNEEGQLVFADPSGGYRITLGHPADGKSRTIELTPAEGDDKALMRLAKEGGQNVEDIPRIAALYWIGIEHVLVKPMAGVDRRTTSRGGTFELFDCRGKGNGRSPLNCGYNPEQDEFFLRNGVLVVIGGGKSANDAAIRHKAEMIGKKTSPVPGAPPDLIRVQAYDLVAHYTGLARFRKSGSD